MIIEDEKLYCHHIQRVMDEMTSRSLKPTLKNFEAVSGVVMTIDYERGTVSLMFDSEEDRTLFQLRWG